MNTFFYITAGIAVVAAVLALTRKEAMHGILYLIATLLAMAILFFLLGAPFVAALEIIVYAGAIVVLFLFVVMMINPPVQSRGASLSGWGLPLLFVIVLAAEMAWLLRFEAEPMSASPVEALPLAEAPRDWTGGLISCMTTVLFLGGWHGPSFFPPLVWFILKVSGLIFLFMWVRGSLPRVRYDQLMSFGWKYLIEIALLNVLVTGAIGLWME